jgi:hypothetical protein
MWPSALSIVEILTETTIDRPSAESGESPAFFRKSSETITLREALLSNALPRYSSEKSFVRTAADGRACAFVEKTESPTRASTAKASYG